MTQQCGSSVVAPGPYPMWWFNRTSVVPMSAGRVFQYTLYHLSNIKPLLNNISVQGSGPSYRKSIAAEDPRRIHSQNARWTVHRCHRKLAWIGLGNIIARRLSTLTVRLPLLGSRVRVSVARRWSISDFFMCFSGFSRFPNFNPSNILPCPSPPRLVGRLAGRAPLLAWKSWRTSFSTEWIGDDINILRSKNSTQKTSPGIVLMAACVPPLTK